MTLWLLVHPRLRSITSHPSSPGLGLTPSLSLSLLVSLCSPTTKGAEPPFLQGCPVSPAPCHFTLAKPILTLKGTKRQSLTSMTSLAHTCSDLSTESALLLQFLRATLFVRFFPVLNVEGRIQFSGGRGGSPRHAPLPVLSPHTPS